MLAPPADLAEGDLRAALARGWGLEAASLMYRPVGFGSHHWELLTETGDRWFVTVDDLAAPRATSPDGWWDLASALGAATQLRAAGHEFVIAPDPTRDGAVFAELDRFAVALFPYVDGEHFDYGAFASDEHRAGVVDLLVRLHGVDPAVAPAARIDDFAIPYRAELEQGMIPDTWSDVGPYAASTAAVLADHADALRAALVAYDARVADTTRGGFRAVVTHGEPHAGNTMRIGSGWVLIDWDTTLVAPPERDLWSLDPGDGSAWAAYEAAVGVTLDGTRLDLYRRRWDLADLAWYTRDFRSPHDGDANDVQAWANVQELVARLAG